MRLTWRPVSRAPAPIVPGNGFVYNIDEQAQSGISRGRETGVCLPTFLTEYGTTVGAGRLFDYETPTLGGVLGAAVGWQQSKLIGLIVLPLAVLSWWRAGAQWDIRTLVDVTLLTSIITAPFGWSYDFVLLLVPQPSP